MTPVFQILESVVPKMDGWCTVPKAHALAATVFALRPELSVEIGVWGGRSLVAMALAHKEVGKGSVWAIDPWNRADSVEAQPHPADAKWWGQIDHQLVMNRFIQSLQTLNIAPVVKVIRARSDDVSPPDNIGVLSLDGNHGPNALRDAERFGPKIKKGGVIFLDDVHWTGGHVERAMGKLLNMGFTRLYAIENTVVLQRL